jgi:AhpD family alkylhydroperoxidase
MTTNTERELNGKLREEAARLDWATLAPEAYKAMIRLDTAAKLGVDPTLLNLVKIRASQLNHCAFCLDMHTRDARRHGVSDQKLDVLAAWPEAGSLFTEREQAALALTEAITDLGDGHVPDDVYQRAARVFSERELGQVIAMAVTINAWNRINVSVRVQPPTR